MKIAIYCRVSTEDQHTENQELRLIDYCQRNNHTYEVFTETESTRKTRPVKAKLLDRLRKREFDAVLVYKLDRWGRSTTELLLEIEELHNRGVGFISFSENLDFSTSIGKLQIAILSAFAQFERDLIRQRTMEGLNRARAQGKTLGRPRKNPPLEKMAVSI
jgi:putative DNA-invertase from lambdoid prophage Rac